MPISYDFKTIFVHIPKNAGTSIEKYLGTGSIKQIYSHKPVNESGLVYSTAGLTAEEAFQLENICPQHLSASQLKRLIPSDTFSSFYKFAVIGNPYDRMISEYFYVQSNEHARYKPYKHLSFEQFLMRGFSASPADQLRIFDGHFLLQKTFILDSSDNVLVNELFSMEDIPKLETKLKEITKLNMPIPNARPSPSIDKASMLTDSARGLIYGRFAEDFAFFGYNA